MDVTGAESETDKLIGYSDIPEKEIETELDEILFEADQIVFGESFEDIAYLVDVDESEKRFDLEEQINDLYDDILVQSNFRKNIYC